MDNKVLKKAIKSQDEGEIIKAFEYIYSKYYKLVWFIISKYVYNVLDIEDISQTVFINFYNNIKKLDLNKNIKYYLVTSAKNSALNFKKNNSRIEYDDVFVYEQRDNNDNYFYSNLISDLKKVLNNLEIAVIIKHIVEGQSLKDIAISLNKNTNTIRTIYNRAIKKYKKFIGVSNETDN